MILFGPAGAPSSTKGRRPEDGVREVSRLGLDCMELEFVRGVRMSDEGVARVRAAALETGVVLTAHGPYYINLASREEAIAVASVERILSAARRCDQAGGVSVTFHAAFYQGRGAEEIYKIVAGRLREVLRRLEQEGVTIAVSPELTGKPSQFGSLAELIRLCREVKGIRPCIDFSHYAARENGDGNGYEGFKQALAALRRGLGAPALKSLHMHASGIEWGEKGEKRHRRIMESDFDWKALIQVLVDQKVSGTLICESPEMAEDALIMKAEYKRRLKKTRP
jgi:deoxyribonuclease-4